MPRKEQEECSCNLSAAPDDAADTFYDIDTDLYQIMEAQRRSVQLGHDKWFQLADDNKMLWDKLTDGGKRVILGLTGGDSKPRARPPAAHGARAAPLAPPRRLPQRVNTTELSPDEHRFLEAALHDFREGRDGTRSDHETDDNITSTPEAQDNLDQLYAYETQRRTPSQSNAKIPGDITRLLSKAFAKKE